MTFTHLPTAVIWDITYACPLRCGHCYSESGRRPKRELPPEEALRLCDVLVSMRPRVVQFSGGEPLLVRELPALLERLEAGGVRSSLYTSGYGVDEESAAWIARLAWTIHVSVDGADAATHDFIRGRKGSFEKAMTALSLFDRLAAQRRERDAGPIEFGIDFSVVRSNFHQLERMCAEVAPRFPHLRHLNLAAAVPSGLANREGYAELELLSDEQMAVLRDRDFVARLRALAPDVARVSVSDNLHLQMHPDQIAAGEASVQIMEIEPDGKVRAMPIYEGTVGNILEEPPEMIWRRAQERRHDAFVVRELSRVRSMNDWATAARNIDRHFASPAELLRISRRKEYTEEAHRKYLFPTN
jgi:MoaA/NifB/PqqE/SkfB family radical SAM enzyme